MILQQLATRNSKIETRKFESPDPLKDLEKLLAPIQGVKLAPPAILPTFVGGHHWLESWLEPVTAAGAAFAAVELPHGRTELFLVGGAVLVGAVGLILGYRATRARRIPPAREAPADTGLALVLNRKYYVDEIYDAVVVRPLVWLSRVVLWKGVDEGVVDGAAVNGSARLSRGLGWLGSRLQTGQVGVYVVLFLVGALWVLRAVIR